MLLDAHGHNLHTQGTPITPTDAPTHSQHPQEGFNGRCLTQFYVLVIGEDEDDVGPHVAYVAVSLQARPEAISGQVARALSRREGSHKGQNEEKRERGKEPLPCHRWNLQSPPRYLVSHAGFGCRPERQDMGGD